MEDILNLYLETTQKFKNTGKLVRNTRSGVIGVVLREHITGQVQVLESIQPYIINTHDNWDTLELVEEEN